MKSKLEQTLILTLLFICSIIYNIYLIHTPAGLYDEGIILAGAERILNGDYPYLDFWSMYPPGQYYILSLLFKFFGTSFLTARIYDIVIKAFITVFLYFLIKKLSLSNRLAIAGYCIVLFYIDDFSKFSLYPIYPAILFLFFSVNFFINYVSSKKNYHLILSCFFITISSIFRHDLGFLLAVSIFIALFIFKIENKSSYKVYLCFFSSLIISTSPIAIYLSYNVGLWPIVEQLLLTPSDIMPKYRWLPYPTDFSFDTLKYYVYPFVVLSGCLVAFFFLLKKKSYTAYNYGLLILSLTGVFFINQVRIRSDSVHLVPTTILAIIVGLLVFFKFLTITKNKLSILFLYLYFLVFLTPFIPLYENIQFRLEWNIKTLSVLNKINKAEHILINNNLKSLIFFIKKYTNEDDYIYVGVKDHDQFILNNPTIYFLADRKYATKYHELHPGVTNTKKIQNEIISELINKTVKIIVLASGYCYEPNKTSINSNINLLDNYILQNYTKVQSFGSHDVWIEKFYLNTLLKKKS